ncbi:hypothetical protein QQF64_034807 [Cirrhinus molitorella]|uniref:Uncharacterized protein n=1 Tax=Cirrhinus molitorella TaxID=172907 RepID=A0ABR3L4Y7_9TELE
MMLRRPCWICGYGGIEQAGSDGILAHPLPYSPLLAWRLQGQQAVVMTVELASSEQEV